MTTERGSTSGEIVILIPLLMSVILLIVYVGRVSSTKTTLQHIADVAAREASKVSQSNVERTAMNAAQRELRRGDISCGSVNVRARQIRSSYQISVHVSLTCRTVASDVAIVGLVPVTIHVSSSSVIDRYRSYE